MNKQEIFKFNFTYNFDEQNFLLTQLILMLLMVYQNRSQNIFLYGPKKSGKTSQHIYGKI